MTYYNILFKFGVEEFFKKAVALSIKGFIVPDLPPEEAYKLGKKNYNAFDFPFLLRNLVLTYTLADDFENALHTLQELLETRSLFTLEFMKTDPDLKPLLSDPDFKNVNP